MINSINQAFYQVSFFSLLAASLWGVLSVFLSPCHLGSIPLIVAYINDHKAPGRFKAFRLSLFFGLGILIMLGIIGVLTSLGGRVLGDIGPVVTIIIAVFLMICGLWLMDLPIFKNFHISLNLKSKYSGLIGALVLGFTYGIILGPCSFAFLAPMIGLVFSKSLNSISFGISLMVFYALGHTAAIIGAGTFGDYIINLFKRDGISKIAVLLKKSCGLIVLIFGGWKLFTSF
jgi:cytochrome c-type biogenesis protein